MIQVKNHDYLSPLLPASYQNYLVITTEDSMKHFQKINEHIEYAEKLGLLNEPIKLDDESVYYIVQLVGLVIKGPVNALVLADECDINAILNG